MNAKSAPRDPLIFLSTDISTAATRMLELIGALRVAERCEPYMVDGYLNDLRREIATVSASMAHFDRIPTDMRGEMIAREQYEAPAPVKQPEVVAS